MADRHDTVMLVEDDAQIRLLLGGLLREEGYHVVEAPNGLEALLKLRAGLRPCLILLDIMMPVMNGWEFYTAQHADPSLSAIPVLVVSADSALRNRVMEQGIVDFLPKPVDIDLLLEAITRHCPGDHTPST